MGAAVSRKTRSSPRDRRGESSSEEDPEEGPPRPRRFLHPELAEATTVLTWNVAAVNNNPFEYWVDFKDRVYQDLMQGVELVLADPGGHDIEVCEVFTEDMFQDLKTLCANEGMESLAELEEGMWHGGSLRLAHRKIVSEFIKDASLGAKRLISMPDRVTNTINVVTRRESGYRPPPVCRPSVINNYEGDLSTVDVWWEDWKRFMFFSPLTVRTRSGTAVQRPVEMLEPIPRSKYPAVAEDEERLALPLQVLCQAIFDAVIVHLLNKLSPKGEWQVIKSKICDKLYRRKHTATMEILDRRYSEVHIICLQEVAAVFRDTFQDSALRHSHELVLPSKLDGKRDQNSLILLKKDVFRSGSIREVTPSIAQHLDSSLKLADGDLIAVEAEHQRSGRKYLIISFHGDTNGLLTVPLLHATEQAVKSEFPSHVVLLALDANVYETEGGGRKLFRDFIADVQPMGLTTCWGDSPDPAVCRTTCNARTSLQPQLNKAVRYADIATKSDMNPKDIILFYKSQLAVVPEQAMGKDRQPNPMKDNTGKLWYKEASVFPTIDFPSDHGVLAVALQLID